MRKVRKIIAQFQLFLKSLNYSVVGICQVITIYGIRLPRRAVVVYSQDQCKQSLSLNPSPLTIHLSLSLSIDRWFVFVCVFVLLRMQKCYRYQSILNEI